MLSQLLLVASLCLPPVPRPASTCSCLGPFPPVSDSAVAHAALSTADVVFIGAATSVGDTIDIEILRSGRFPVRKRRATFAVQAAWKAALSRAITVLTSTSDSNCGYHFTPGQRYLVFATVGANGTLYTMSCTPTQEVGTARKHLLGLGKPRVRYALPDSGSAPR